MESRFGSAPKQPRSEQPAPRRSRNENVIPLTRTKSRAAFVIRLIAKINVAISLIIHVVLYITLAAFSAPRALPFGVLLVFILTFCITLLGAWLINMMAEPFEHLRNCSDSLENIERMMAHQLNEQGIRTKEEFY